MSFSSIPVMQHQDGPTPFFAHITSLKIVAAWCSKNSLDLYDNGVVRGKDERLVVVQRRNNLPDSLRVWCDILFQEMREVPVRADLMWLYYMLHKDPLYVVNMLITRYGRQRVPVMETATSLISHLNFADAISSELLRSWLGPLTTHVLESGRSQVNRYKPLLSMWHNELQKWISFALCAEVFSSVYTAFPDESLFEFFHSLGTTVDDLIYRRGQEMSEADAMYVAAGNHCTSFVDQHLQLYESSHWYTVSSVCAVEGTLIVPAVQVW